MAKVKFLIQSSSINSQIYLRLSLGRGKVLKKKTGLTINSKDWSAITSLPKQNDAVNKALFTQLKSLETNIYDKLNIDSLLHDTIDSNWLEEQINIFFNRSSKNEFNLLIDYIQFFIDNANLREIQNGKLGLSTGTISNYKTFKRIIEEFEQYIKKNLVFEGLTTELLHKFKQWMINQKLYSVNYAGKNIRMLKTVLNDAVLYGKVFPNDINKIKSIKEQDVDRYIINLNLEEIKRIYNTVMPTKTLEDAKKWLIIGCYIGQRKSDLLAITKDNIRQTAKGLFIDITQKKTGKHVTVAIAEPFVIDIILDKFPNAVSDHELGKYFKKVCELAEINEPIKGYIIKGDNKRKTKRKELGVFPKYQLITSHVCRRSFATNFYKMMPTSILIAITGHSSEDMFLKYINKRVDKDENANLFMQYYEQMTKDIKPTMTIIKKVN
ncbi:tyrosine-type recombinase/integrase [Sphingobacterium rhinopitheci]|uniref:tyrosine-type recombinase/integrase n=1 Tax=Sphingobacterium rhinopitheci TaxID=2781960 RepID=UPI001F527307|nr:site-specific integrase [Sphingobacterium rhinopitheci]MCI0922521.1 site-specific integrase [Sphingobacterium rhinopitheci]